MEAKKTPSADLTKKTGMFLNLVLVMEHQMVLRVIHAKIQFAIICRFIQDFKKFKIVNLEKVQIGPLVCKKIQPQ